MRPTELLIRFSYDHTPLEQQHINADSPSGPNCPLPLFILQIGRQRSSRPHLEPLGCLYEDETLSSPSDAPHPDSPLGKGEESSNADAVYLILPAAWRHAQITHTHTLARAPAGRPARGFQENSPLLHPLSPLPPFPSFPRYTSQQQRDPVYVSIFWVPSYQPSARSEPGKLCPELR